MPSIFYSVFRGELGVLAFPPCGFAGGVLLRLLLLPGLFDPALALALLGVRGAGGGIDQRPETREIELLARNSPRDDFSVLVCLLNQHVRRLEDSGGSALPSQMEGRGYTLLLDDDLRRPLLFVSADELYHFQVPPSF